MHDAERLKLHSHAEHENDQFTFCNSLHDLYSSSDECKATGILNKTLPSAQMIKLKKVKGSEVNNISANFHPPHCPFFFHR